IAAKEQPCWTRSHASCVSAPLPQHGEWILARWHASPDGSAGAGYYVAVAAEFSLRCQSTADFHSHDTPSQESVSRCKEYATISSKRPFSHRRQRQFSGQNGGTVDLIEYRVDFHKIQAYHLALLSNQLHGHMRLTVGDASRHRRPNARGLTWVHDIH